MYLSMHGFVVVFHFFFFSFKFLSKKRKNKNKKYPPISVWDGKNLEKKNKSVRYEEIFYNVVTLKSFDSILR